MVLTGANKNDQDKSNNPEDNSPCSQPMKYKYPQTDRKKNEVRESMIKHLSLRTSHAYLSDFVCEESGIMMSTEYASKRLVEHILELVTNMTTLLAPAVNQSI